MFHDTDYEGGVGHIGGEFSNEFPGNRHVCISLHPCYSHTSKFPAQIASIRPVRQPATLSRTSGDGSSR